MRDSTCVEGIDRVFEEWSGNDFAEELIWHRYGLVGTTINRIMHGEGAYNFHVSSASGAYLLKISRPGASVDEERAACDLTMAAAAAPEGLPVPKFLPDVNGSLVSSSKGVISTFREWADGSVERGLRIEPSREIGRVLGQIHSVFSREWGFVEESEEIDRWWRKISYDIVLEKTRALTLIAERGCGRSPCEFDDIAVNTLHERICDIEWLREGETRALGIRAQILHGNYAPGNIILDGDHVAAVIDFRPPDPFYASYELGRIAFFPAIGRPYSEAASLARELAAGYLDTCPEAKRNDIILAPRMALLQLMSSFYGIREHFKGDGMFQESLDAFWIARHQMSRMLLANLNHAEHMMDCLYGFYE